MSELLDVIDNLRRTGAAISVHEKAIQEHPQYPSLVSSLRSLRKQQQLLETEFARLTNEGFIDVCSYRIFSQRESEQPTLRALASALLTFQTLFTVTYDAVKNGPKERSRTGIEVDAATAFNFGYSFSGSVGFVLTLTTERLLFGETDYDKAMFNLFAMAQSQTSQDVSNWAKQLGAAPVKKMYEWAATHSESGVGADIDWKRETQVLSHLFVDSERLEQLRQVIARTGEENVEEVTLPGELLGIDVKSKSFRMKFAGNNEVTGKMSVLINTEYTVPKRYTARLRKTTRINYAKAEDDVEYLLISLQP